ncbi:MAG: hypothetical protein KHY31_04170 [Clostridiales bacterium]|nr:hypothetical protein [Clostridiales bacterium]
MKKKYQLSEREKKAEKIKYITESVKKKCKEGNYKRVGVLTSSKYRETKEKIVNELAERCQEIEFIDLRPVNMYADVLQQLIQCDGTILVEKYRNTTYQEFEKTIELLKKFDIKVIGLITYK